MGEIGSYVRVGRAVCMVQGKLGAGAGGVVNVVVYVRVIGMKVCIDSIHALLCTEVADVL